jgi:heparan-alpha-glucosaminide N-acetyltransferase
MLIYLPEGILHLLLLVVYLYFTLFFSYRDGCPASYQGPGGHHIHSKYINCTGGAANYLDQIIFGDKHIYHTSTSKKVFGHPLDHDPEGLLGFTTSILLTEIGLICGRIIIKERSHYGRLTRWAIIGVVCGLLGTALTYMGVTEFGHGVIPIVKNLWSLSFILVCGSLSIGGFLVMYILVDVTQTWRNGSPFHFPGCNAILLYVGHEVCSRFFPFFFDVDDSSHAWLLLRSAWNASLWLLISVYFYHKRLFWKL